MRDYIITVDDNGSPIISHAGLSVATNRAHKYIMKIGEGAKARYFYTQEEIRAYQNAAKQGVKSLNSDLKKRKTAKEAEKAANSGSADAAQDKYRKKFAEATKKTYDKTKLGKAENAVRSTIEDVVSNVNEKLSKNEKEREEKRIDGLTTAFQGAAKQVNAKNQGSDPSRKHTAKEAADLINKYDEGAEMLKKGTKKYNDNRSVLTEAASKFSDKADKIKNKASNAVDKTVETVKDKAGVDEKKAALTLKSAKDRMKNEFRKKADSTKDKALDAANKVKSKAEEAKDQVTNKIDEVREDALQKKVEKSKAEQRKINEQKQAEKEIENHKNFDLKKHHEGLDRYDRAKETADKIDSFVNNEDNPLSPKEAARVSQLTVKMWHATQDYGNDKISLEERDRILNEAEKEINNLAAKYNNGKKKSK